MREYKFRVWDTGIKKMSYDNFYIKNDGQVCFYWQQESFNSINAILMQFTGLKDKNNIDIYESDRVFCFLDGKQMDADDEIGFYNGSFWLKRRNISVEYFLTNDGKYNTELLIYSNIYETKPQTITE